MYAFPNTSASSPVKQHPHRSRIQLKDKTQPIQSLVRLGDESRSANNSADNHDERTSIVQLPPPLLQTTELMLHGLVSRLLLLALLDTSLELLGQDSHALVHGHHDAKSPRGSGDVEDRRGRELREFCGEQRRRIAVVVRSAGADEVGQRAQSVEGREKVLAVVQQVRRLLRCVVHGDGDRVVGDGGHDQRGLKGGAAEVDGAAEGREDLEGFDEPEGAWDGHCEGGVGGMITMVLIVMLIDENSTQRSQRCVYNERSRLYLSTYLVLMFVCQRTNGAEGGMEVAPAACDCGDLSTEIVRDQQKAQSSPKVYYHDGRIGEYNHHWRAAGITRCVLAEPGGLGFQEVKLFAKGRMSRGDEGIRMDLGRLVSKLIVPVWWITTALTEVTCQSFISHQLQSFRESVIDDGPYESRDLALQTMECCDIYRPYSNFLRLSIISCCGGVVNASDLNSFSYLIPSGAQVRILSAALSFCSRLGFVESSIKSVVLFNVDPCIRMRTVLVLLRHRQIDIYIPTLLESPDLVRQYLSIHACYIRYPHPNDVQVMPTRISNPKQVGPAGSLFSQDTVRVRS